MLGLKSFVISLGLLYIVFFSVAAVRGRYNPLIQNHTILQSIGAPKAENVRRLEVDRFPSGTSMQAWIGEDRSGATVLTSSPCIARMLMYALEERLPVELTLAEDEHHIETASLHKRNAPIQSPRPLRTGLFSVAIVGIKGESKRGVCQFVVSEPGMANSPALITTDDMTSSDLLMQAWLTGHQVQLLIREDSEIERVWLPAR